MAKLAVTQAPDLKSPDHMHHVASGAAKGAAIGTVLNPGMGTIIGTAIGGVAGSIGGRKEMAQDYARGYKEVKNPTFFNKELLIGAVVGSFIAGTGGLGAFALGVGSMVAGGAIGKNRLETENAQAEGQQYGSMSYKNLIPRGDTTRALQLAQQNKNGVGPFSNRVAAAREAAAQQQAVPQPA